jgi:hypothetical protein
MDVAKGRSSGPRHARPMQRDRINIDRVGRKKIQDGRSRANGRANARP